VMAEERAFITALSSAATWRVRQSTLELLSATGGRLVSARRGAALPPDAATASPGSGPQAPAQARPTRLVGPVWRLVSFDRWRENDPALDSAGITARFTPARVTGHAGCNRYSATARIEGPRLLVRGVVGTLMACPAIDVEQAFKQALGRTERFEIKDGRLLVTYDGDKVMTFAPAPPPA
jgi:heat shock protein HslJ